MVGVRVDSQSRLTGRLLLSAVGPACLLSKSENMNRPHRSFCDVVIEVNALTIMATTSKHRLPFHVGLNPR